MKFRSGVTQTLTDKPFSDYRFEIDTITHIGKCLFWGNLVASQLVGALIGGFIFLCLWQVSIVWIQ